MKILSRMSEKRLFPRKTGGQIQKNLYSLPFILSFIIQDVFKLTESKTYDVSEIVSSEVRIILLYCRQEEAKHI